MKVIIGTRNSGKTHEAIALANKRNAHLVVNTEKMKRIVIDQMPDVKHRVFSYHDIKRGRLEGIHPNRIVIDDLEWFIQSMIGSLEVAGVTMNQDEKVQFLGGLKQ